MSSSNKQSENLKKKTRWVGLRGKLLIVTLFLLIFPFAGFSYLQELEQFLKKNHAESVLIIAKTIASQFNDNASLISQNAILQSPQPVFYSHPLKSSIIIDGYSDDWFTLQNVQHTFQSATIKDNIKMSILCANDADYYYFLMTIVQDKKAVSKTLGQISYLPDTHKDRISFRYLDYSRQIRNFQFELTTPGWVNAYPENILEGITGQTIRGEWQPAGNGYILEFKIPANRINRHIAFELQSSNTKTVINTVTEQALLPAHQLNPLVTTDPLSAIRLKRLVPEKAQLWLLNNRQFVNAHSDYKHNSYQNENTFTLLSWLRRIYMIFLNYPEQKAHFGNNQAYINNVAIRNTLTGNSYIEWLENPRSNQLTLSVSTPVYDSDNNVIGLLLLQQDNHSVLTLQDQTFERIILLTILLFFGISVGLLFISTRLVRRIIKLRNDTDLALSSDGIISNQLFRKDNDEIGDLARSFSNLLAQVEQNQQYLKTLASKLSHELRTPLTIIKSSLENIDVQSLSKDNQKYSERAKEGCIRLGELLNRMSEASRLEQSIKSIDKEPVDMVRFLRTYIDSIQSINTDIDFIYTTTVTEQELIVSPELIAQLLDKIINNAISFHQHGTPISIYLTSKQQYLVIEINNIGPLVDSNKMESIFNSLTTYREPKNKYQEAHLGLGLYIARLISLYHGGSLEVSNKPENHSVSFYIRLPVQI